MLILAAKVQEGRKVAVRTKRAKELKPGGVIVSKNDGKSFTVLEI